MNDLKVIITGASGMIGEGVLHECLNHNRVKKVLVITRRTCGYSHPKLTEIIHDDFFDISTLRSQINGYNTCFFCLGTSAVGKSEIEYTKLTYTLTLNFATTLSKLNPEMTFCYISGAGTDSTEKGRIMWARVKGKTENDLLKLAFKNVYNFRPGGIIPFLPLKPSQTYYKMYKYTKWLFSFIKIFFPNLVISLRNYAAAMINVSLLGYEKKVLEMKDINKMARLNS